MESQLHSRTVILCFLGIICWNLVVSVDMTCLSVALPTIAHDLHADSTQIYWTGTAFVLCSAAFQPVFASYSGAFGRKPVILLALTLFTAGAIICGAAHDIPVLLVGRCIQGVGGGGLITMTYVIMADMFTVQERSKYVGVISLTWLVGAVCGPVLGGGFTESVTWRWIFWFNLPFCGIIYFMVIFILPNTYTPDRPFLSRLRRFDWIGSMLFVGSLTSFLVALSWGGVMFAWSSWHTVVPLVLGLVGLIFWVLYSVYLTAHPMIPIVILKDKSTAINYFCTVIHGMGQFGSLYYLPLYYQAAKSYSPMISGVALLPQCTVAGPLAAITGLILARSPCMKLANFVGWVLFALGLGLLTMLSASTSIVEWIFINAPMGIGLGILFASLALATQASAEHRSNGSPAEKAKIRAMAAGLNPFFRALGQAFGIVVGQAAFTNEMRRNIGEVAAKNAAEIAGSIGHLAGDNAALRIRLVGAFIDSLRVVWWILFALAAFAGLLTLLTTDVEPEKAVIKGGVLQDEMNEEDLESGANSVKVRLEGRQVSSNSTMKSEVSVRSSQSW